VQSETLKFCCYCGKELIFKSLFDGSNEKYCEVCNHVFFNAPSPAVIVAIIHDDKILLTRSVGWRHLYWGLVAGHIKPGETAEEAVTREVREEVGLDIYQTDFLGSYGLKQRNILMLGFQVNPKSSEIKSSQELEKAAWFKISEPLPIRPNSITTKILKRVISNLSLINPES
jgi:NAD+ diphosphatase